MTFETPCIIFFNDFYLFIFFMQSIRSLWSFIFFESLFFLSSYEVKWRLFTRKIPSGLLGGLSSISFSKNESKWWVPFWFLFFSSLLKLLRYPFINFLHCSFQPHFLLGLLVVPLHTDVFSHWPNMECEEALHPSFKTRKSSVTLSQGRGKGLLSLQW